MRSSRVVKRRDELWAELYTENLGSPQNEIYLKKIFNAGFNSGISVTLETAYDLAQKIKEPK